MAEGGQESWSGSNSHSQPRTETNVTVSLNKEEDVKVQMLLTIRGLKPISGFQKLRQKFRNIFSKHNDPNDLCANAKFTRWELSATSVALTVCVQTEKPRKKSTAETTSDVPTEVFNFEIRRLISEIDPKTVKLEIMQPPGRSFSYIVLTMQKLPNSVSWKKFFAVYQTFDASNICMGSQ